MVLVDVGDGGGDSDGIGGGVGDGISGVVLVGVCICDG